jgi:hypothetical protein
VEVLRLSTDWFNIFLWTRYWHERPEKSMRSGKFDDAGNFAHLAGMNQFRWLMINCVKSRDLFRDGELSPTGRGPSSGDVPWRGTKIFLLTFNSAD